MLAAVKAAVRAAMNDVEAPVGGHAANGEAEGAEMEIKRAVRTLKSSLEEKIGVTVDVSHPILIWLPRRGAKCLSRYRIGDDGRAAEQRRTGKRWLKPTLKFGGLVHVRLAVAHEARSGFQPSLIEGRCGQEASSR